MAALAVGLGPRCGAGRAVAVGGDDCPRVGAEPRLFRDRFSLADQPRRDDESRAFSDWRNAARNKAMTLPDRAMRGRIIALALLALLLLGFWFGPVSAYVGLLQSGADEIDQKMALLQRYRVLATSAPRLETTGPASAEANILMPDLPE